MKIISYRSLAFLCALAALPGSSLAFFNGIKVNERVFNDFTTSTLTITNSNSIPGSVTIDDRNLTNDGIGGNFANRHDALISSDNGATGHVFTTSSSFRVSANVTLTTGSNSPRKEAGFRINSNVTGDALFLVNSDAGEIVAFGGGAPFKLFGKNSTNNGYTVGTTILMGMEYRPGQNGAKGTLEYFIDRGQGLESSGQLTYDNLEGGPVNFTVGMYAQVSPATGSDFITAEFNNIQAVPEPGTMAALALGGFALLRKRRR